MALGWMNLMRKISIDDINEEGIKNNQKFYGFQTQTKAKGFIGYHYSQTLKQKAFYASSFDGFTLCFYFIGYFPDTELKSILDRFKNNNLDVYEFEDYKELLIWGAME